MTVGGTCHTRPEILNGGTRLERTLVRIAFALLACFAAVFSTSAQSPATNANRFLFIIDTSASMKPFDKALRETVFDLVYSGVRGQMTNGDTYGLWLVNDQTDTSFAMESWGQRYGVELGAKATAHVKQHGYRGKARLDLVFADALRVARRVGDLTIILVSNGETPIAGTPFDAVVNDRFRQLVPEMKRAKATLNTAFVARDGEIVAWAANSSDFLVAVPYIPPTPKPPALEAAAVKAHSAATPLSNSIANVSASAPAAPTNVEPPKPRVVPKPIIITKETVAEEKRTYQSLTMTGSTNESGLSSITTNTVAAEYKLATTNAPGASVTNVTDSQPLAAARAIPPQSSTLPTGPGTDRPPTNANIVLAKIAPTNSAVAAAVSVKVSGTEPSRVPSRIHPVFWAAIGAGAALLAVLVIVLAFRSRRQEPSLISQTMGLQRIESPKI